MKPARTCDALVGALDDHGLVLVQDTALPSVCTLVAGEPISGSWWGHREGTRIFHLLGELSESSGVMWTKLVSGKGTLVARRLWPAFLAVAEAREDWQTAGLSPGADRMLEALGATGEVHVSGFDTGTTEKATKVATLLERRLLAYSYQEHAEGGKHVKVLLPWPRWRADHAPDLRLVDPEAGRAELEERLGSLNAAAGARGRLPWGVTP